MSQRPGHLIRPYHWALWALESRDTGRGALGYPSQQPYYTPSRRRGEGQALADQDLPPDPPTLRDLEIVDAIGKAVSRLAARGHIWVALLREYHGAYPGAPYDHGPRIARCKRLLQASKTTVYTQVDCAAAYVEGAVEQLLARGAAVCLSG